MFDVSLNIRAYPDPVLLPRGRFRLCEAGGLGVSPQRGARDR